MSKRFALAVTLLLAAGFAVVPRAPAAEARGRRDVQVHLPPGSLGATLSGGAGHTVGSKEKGTRIFVFAEPPAVLSVRSEGPAAGVLREGDLILAVDGEDIATESASRRIQRPAEGEVLELTIQRDGRRHEVTVTCGEAGGADSGERSSVEVVVSGDGGDPELITLTEVDGHGRVVGRSQQAQLSGRIRFGSWYGMGLEAGCITLKSKDEAHHYIYFEDPPRVYSVDPDGPADRAGIRRGDVLVQIDGLQLDRDAGGRRWSTAEPGESVRFTVHRDGEVLELVVVPQENPAGGTTIFAGTEGAASAGVVAGGHLRYAGSLDGVDVEVRGGGGVSVTRTHDMNETVLISVGDVVVKLTRRSGED